MNCYVVKCIRRYKLQILCILKLSSSTLNCKSTGNPCDAYDGREVGCEQEISGWLMLLVRKEIVCQEATKTCDCL